MRGVVMHAPGDIRVEQREDPRITAPTDAVIRLSAAGKVFDLDLPLDQAAEAYQAMDERRAIKALLRV